MAGERVGLSRECGAIPAPMRLSRKGVIWPSGAPLLRKWQDFFRVRRYTSNDSDLQSRILLEHCILTGSGVPCRSARKSKRKLWLNAQGGDMRALKTIFAVAVSSFFIAAAANTQQKQTSDSEYIAQALSAAPEAVAKGDRKSTRLNSSHGYISYAVFC